MLKNKYFQFYIGLCIISNAPLSPKILGKGNNILTYGVGLKGACGKNESERLDRRSINAVTCVAHTILTFAVRQFLQRTQCSHCKRCISYSNSVRLSVCPSVCLSVTRRYCVKTTERSTVQFALLDSKMCLFVETKKYSTGTTPSP